jgi:hypothetical protein
VQVRGNDGGTPFLGFPLSRHAAAIVAAAAVAIVLALPAVASAAQTLTVTKAGTGSGTVVSSPSGINCGATCSFAFADNAAVTLTGAAGANTAAVQWSGCDSVNIENKCKVAMSAARGVTATFNLLQRELKVTKAGNGTGTVTSSPAGIDCGSTCAATFAHGTAVVLTASPGPNTLPVAWSGCTSVSEGECNVTMSAAKAVTATFKLPSQELKVTKAGAGSGTVTSSPAGINCGATCAASFEQGTQVTLTGAPGANTKAVQWSGCDSVAEGKCKVTLGAARSVTATFNVEGPLLTVTRTGPAAPFSSVTSSPAGINCGATCATNFVKDSTVTLTGLPGLHVKAVQWSGCTSVNGENKCLVTMSAAKEVTATFEFEPGFTLHTVAVEKTGTGQGTVTGSPGSIDCGSVCADELITDTVLTLTATPAPGSAFDHWSGGKCSGTSPTCERTVNSDRTVKAIFVATGTRTLTISKAGSGAGTVKSKAAGIECKSSCTAELAASKKVTLTATPDAGSVFAGFSGACTGTKTCTLTMSEARQLTATFNGPPPPDTGGGLGGKPGAAVIAAAAKVKRGVARVKILCNGPSPCKGAMRLFAKLTPKGKAVTIGSASFDLAPGASKMLAVPLSRKAKAALKAGGHLKAKVTGTGIHAHPVSLKPQGK